MLRSKNKEKGFTLIELILVIVILGILSAVALPKFVDLKGDAQKARNQGALAAFSGAITMLHGQFLINGASSDYDAASVAAQTEIQGGSNPPGSSANALTVTWDDGVVSNFTYTDNVGNTSGAVSCNPANCS